MTRLPIRHEFPKSVTFGWLSSLKTMSPTCRSLSKRNPLNKDIMNCYKNFLKGFLTILQLYLNSACNFTKRKTATYLNEINFRENLFSRMNFFGIPRELIFVNGQILEISPEQIFANEVISNISREFIFANDQIFFFFSIFFFDKKGYKMH